MARKVIFSIGLIQGGFSLENLRRVVLFPLKIRIHMILALVQSLSGQENALSSS